MLQMPIYGCFLKILQTNGAKLHFQDENYDRDKKEKDIVPTMEDLSNVPKDDSNGFSNETQIEILVNADTSGPENGVEKQNNVETENPTTKKKDRSEQRAGLRKDSSYK
ncbi:hypothetical protein ACROYT_G003575 [Oculina patagonica]